MGWLKTFIGLSAMTVLFFSPPFWSCEVENKSSVNLKSKNQVICCDDLMMWIPSVLLLTTCPSCVCHSAPASHFLLEVPGYTAWEVHGGGVGVLSLKGGFHSESFWLHEIILEVLLDLFYFLSEGQHCKAWRDGEWMLILAKHGRSLNAWKDRTQTMCWPLVEIYGQNYFIYCIVFFILTSYVYLKYLHFKQCSRSMWLLFSFLALHILIFSMVKSKKTSHYRVYSRDWRVTEAKHCGNYGTGTK